MSEAETSARLAEIAASAPPGLTEVQAMWLLLALVCAVLLVWLGVIE